MPVYGQAEPVERYPSTTEALALFLQHCRLAGFSPHTIDSYRTRLRYLDGYVHELDQSACIAYLGAELDRGLSEGTVRTTWAALASFCTFAVGQGWLTASPMRGVPCPREHVLGRYLSKAEVGRIWAAAGASGRRYRPQELRLIILLLLEGLRAAELCSIRWSDIREGVLTVKGKGSKFRRIALSDDVLAMLPERRGDCVFHFTTASLRQRIQRLGKRAGIPHLHPHLFRGTWASWWMIEVGDAATLQTLGGWASQQMITQRYAKAAMEQAAIAESQRVGLTKRLLGTEPL